MPSRILIVDDEAPLRALVRHFLEKGGFEVTEAESALEVLQIIERELPDLMLLDVSMPEMDGFQLAAMLKENPEVRRVPKINSWPSTWVPQISSTNHLKRTS